MNIREIPEYKQKMMVLYRVEEVSMRIMQYVGLVGSALMFVVYSQRSLQRLSLSIYFRSMAIACLCQCIDNLIIYDHFYVLNRASIYIINFTNFLWKMIGPLSAWLEMLASFDRFMVILFPLKFRFIQNRCVQRALVLILVFSNTLIYLHYFFTIPPIYGLFCDFSYENSFCLIKIDNILLMIDFLNGTAIPFTVMFALSVCTFAGVCRAHRRIRSFSSSSSSSSRTNNISSQRKLRRDIKFGVSMVVLNLLFFVFVGVNRLNELIGINPFDPSAQIFSNYVFSLVLNNLSENYYLLNFYFQLAVNSLVRKELTNLFVRFIENIKRLFSLFSLYLRRPAIIF